MRVATVTQLWQFLLMSSKASQLTPGWGHCYCSGGLALNQTGSLCCKIILGLQAIQSPVCSATAITSDHKVNLSRKIWTYIIEVQTFQNMDPWVQNVLFGSPCSVAAQLQLLIIFAAHQVNLPPLPQNSSACKWLDLIAAHPSNNCLATQSLLL